MGFSDGAHGGALGAAEECSLLHPGGLGQAATSPALQLATAKEGHALAGSCGKACAPALAGQSSSAARCAVAASSAADSSSRSVATADAFSWAAASSAAVST